MTIQNKANVSLPMAIWLSVDDYAYKPTAKHVSASSFTKSTRHLIAEHRKRYPEEFSKEALEASVGVEFANSLGELDIQDFVASRIGTAIHTAIEEATKDRAKLERALRTMGYTEEQIQGIQVVDEPTDSVACPIYLERESSREIEVNGETFTVTGKFDAVINGELHDIKTTSPYVYQSGCNDENYIIQGSIYRWLNPDIVTEDTLVIDFLFTSFMPSLAGTSEGYPPARAVFKKYKLMSLQETEMFIRNSLSKLQQNWNLPLQAIPCCPHSKLYSKPPQYKYYASGFAPGKRATKVSESYAELAAYKGKKGGSGEIIEFKGEPFMCSWCIPSEVLGPEVAKSEAETREPIEII